MFSSYIANSSSPKGGASGSTAGSSGGKGAKEQQQQQAEAARKAALKEIADGRATIKPLMENMTSVAGSQYWNYGYRGAAMLTFFATSMTLSSRYFPSFSSSANIMALFGGYFAGGYMHYLHHSYCSAKLIMAIDAQVKKLRERDEQTNGFASAEYSSEVDTLRRMRVEAHPRGLEVPDLASDDVKKPRSQMSEAERVEDILAEFDRRRAMQQKRGGQ
jgi:hypothetical protein